MEVDSKRNASTSSVTAGQQALIPGLPCELATCCFACIPLKDRPACYAVNRSWREALSSPRIYQIRKDEGRLEEFLCVCMQSRPAGTDKLHVNVRLLDLRSQRCCNLPPLLVWDGDDEFKDYECIAEGHEIFIVGGARHFKNPLERERPNKYEPLAAVWIFDALKWQWTQGPTLHRPRTTFVVGVLGSRLYAMDGQDPSAPPEYLDLSRSPREWEQVGKQKGGGVERDVQGAFTKDGLFYLIRLDQLKGIDTSAADVFDPTTETWSTVDKFCSASEPPMIISGRSFVVLNNAVYGVFWDPRGPLPMYEPIISVRDDRTGRWQRVITYSQEQQKRHVDLIDSLQLVAVQGKLCAIIGGVPLSGPPKTFLSCLDLGGVGPNPSWVLDAYLVQAAPGRDSRVDVSTNCSL